MRPRIFCLASLHAAPETNVCRDAYAPGSYGATSVSCVLTMWMSSVRTPMASAAIWQNTVSAPWPISVAPICSWNVPSWLSVIWQLDVSSANGATAVL